MQFLGDCIVFHNGDTIAHLSDFRQAMARQEWQASLARGCALQGKINGMVLKFHPKEGVNRY